jgi:hypothetical protein
MNMKEKLGKVAAPRQRMVSLFAATLVLVVGAFPGETRAAEWTIAPYLWGPDVGLDAGLGDGGTEIPLSDLIDKLEMAFMGHVEVRNDKWGGFFDMIYLDLADSTTLDLGPGGPILGELAIDADLTLGLYELGGLYRIGERSPGSAEFDIIFGARQISIDQGFTLTPEEGEGPVDVALLDGSETDVFVGGRVLGLFNERWGYNLRADVGGGGTDGVFTVFGALSYTFGETGLFSMNLGYRYMTIKNSTVIDETPVDVDITLSGPLVGFIFNF